jgi:2-oxoglutarate dehydrogenase E1 component
MKLDEFPGVNAGYVFELYERYRQNPESVDPATQKAFAEWTPADPGTSAPAAAATTAAVGRQADVAAFGLA